MTNPPERPSYEQARDELVTRTAALDRAAGRERELVVTEPELVPAQRVLLEQTWSEQQRVVAVDAEASPKLVHRDIGATLDESTQLRSGAG